MKKLLIAVMMLCLLSGCTVTNDDIVWSEAMCRTNGGIKTIKNSGVNWQSITCENGAMFQRSHDLFR